MATVTERLLGKSIKRREDPRFITGRGTYVDDVKLAGIFADGSPFSFDLNSTGDPASAGGYFLPGSTLTLTRVSLLEGDYNSNGTVDQGDLDLVLLNWGEELFNPIAAGWINDLPDGIIDQDELDGVLLNWGKTSTLIGTANTAAVPEPSAALLLLIQLAVLVATRIRGRVKRLSLPRRHSPAG